MSVTGNQIYCVKCGQEITESQWVVGSVGAMHWKCSWEAAALAQPSEFCIHSVLTPGCESCELKRQKWGIAAPAQPVPPSKRYRFETWAEDHGLDVEREEETGDYVSRETSVAWSAWQACASSPVTLGQNSTSVHDLKAEWMAQDKILDYANWLQSELLKARAAAPAVTPTNLCPNEEIAKRDDLLGAWCDSWNDLRLRKKRDSIQAALFDKTKAIWPTVWPPIEEACKNCHTAYGRGMEMADDATNEYLDRKGAAPANGRGLYLRLDELLASPAVAGRTQLHCRMCGDLVSGEYYSIYHKRTRFHTYECCQCFEAALRESAREAPSDITSKLRKLEPITACPKCEAETENEAMTECCGNDDCPMDGKWNEALASLNREQIFVEIELREEFPEAPAAPKEK